MASQALQSLPLFLRSESLTMRATVLTMGLCWLMIAGPAAGQAPPPPSVALLRSPTTKPNRSLEQQLSRALAKLEYQVMPAAQVAERLGESPACTSEDCALEPLRQQLAVDALILYTSTRHRSGKDSVLLRSTQATDQGPDTHSLRIRQTPRALRKALAQLLAGVTAGPEVASGQVPAALEGADSKDAPNSEPASEQPTTIVVLSTVPPNGKVGIDREPHQEAPAQFKVSAGVHRLYGQLEGYVAVVEEVDIPEQEAPYAYQLVLPRNTAAERASNTQVGEQPELSEVSSWNYVLAAALGVAAVGLTGYAVLESRRDGECLEQSPLDRCIAEADTEAAVIGAAVGASLSGLSAIGLLLFHPLKVQVGEDRAALFVQGRF